MFGSSSSHAGPIQATGIRELVRDFNKLDKDLAKNIKSEIKDVAGVVAEEAKATALRKDLYDTGKLVKSIRPSFRSGRAYVRAGAKRKSFPYPVVYEYGGRGTDSIGPRAFLQPALDAKEEEVVKKLDDTIGSLGQDHGFTH